MNKELTQNNANLSPNIIGTIQNAIRRDKVVSIMYHSKEKGLSTRDVEPMDIIMKNGKTCLVGWCNLREDWRTFRIDRIEKVVIHINQTFDPRSGYNREDFEDKNSRDSEQSDFDDNLPYTPIAPRNPQKKTLDFGSVEELRTYEDDISI
ncbi:MAG: WYL domain-containing protein [Chitinophagales bacterium]|jgi:predicted DNA-binding transcriptional regulator YafY|nr:WYL domain-containing protein [Chitinophagales bacterium]